jgi:hypothetical protein
LKGLIAPFKRLIQSEDAYKKANAAIKKSEGDAT